MSTLTAKKPATNVVNKNLENPIKQYIRDTKGVKVGLLMAGVHENKVAIGFCCLHANDYGKFDAELAETIAAGRARAYQIRIPRHIPPKIEGEISMFVSRCERYFKNARLPEWVEKMGF